MKNNIFWVNSGLIMLLLIPILSVLNFGIEEHQPGSGKNTAVFYAPTPSVITANGPLTFCKGDSVTLSGNVKGKWSTGDTTPSIVVKLSGDYFVTNTDTTGSVNSNHLIVKVDSTPVASVIVALDSTTFCTGDSVILSGNVKGKWNTGDTTVSIKVKTSGDYFVINSNTCDTLTSNHIIVKVNAPLASVITAGSATTMCAGDSVVLSGNVKGRWNTGDTSASIIVKTSGDFFVTNTDSCGSVASNHILVKVDSLPRASVLTASGATTFCAGDSVVLSGNVKGKWSTGDTTASIVVKASGDYFVIHSNTCDTLISNHILVQVNTQPVASVLVALDSTTFCKGDSVILSGNVNGKWSTGDTAASIVVKTSGDYFVVNSNTCDTLTSNHIAVNVNEPVASVIKASKTTVFCAGDSLVLSGNVKGIWSTGDTSASITVKTSGDYFVTNATSCDTLTSNHIIVTVNPKPLAVVAANDTICQGQSIKLGTPAISGHIYKWTTNNGLNVPTGANPEVYPLLTTTYTLTETITATGCTASNTATITVGTLPSCVIKGKNTICNGETTQLCAPAGPYTYRWSTGDTTSCITVDSIGNYAVVVTNAFGCSSACSRNVVSAQTSGVITGKTFIYKGQTSELCAPSGFAAYKWNTGATTRCIIADTSGTYSVSLTNSNGCVSASSTILTVAPEVACEIIGDSLICQGGLSTLCAIDVPGNTYYWNNGQTSRCIEINCQGVYSVTISNNGLSKSCTLVVKNAPDTLPAPDSCFISGNLEPIQGDSSELCATPGYHSYKWNTGATTRCIKIGKSGTYSVKLSIGGSCSDSCSVRVSYIASLKSTLAQVVKVQESTHVANDQMDIKAYPNPFNKQTVVEFLAPENHAHAVIEIINVAGRKVATIFDQEITRGTRYQAILDGHDLAEGVYIYKITMGNRIINKRLVLVR